MKFKIILTLFLMFLSIDNSLACETAQVKDTVINESEEAKKLNQLLANLETFKADFVQIITTETGEKLDQLSGSFALKKPGKFVWKVTQPFEQVLIADGKYLWQYDVDLEQAMVRDLDASLGNTPAQLLSGSITQLEQTYQIKYKKTDKEVFLLTPVEEGQFESIQLSFFEGVLLHLKLEDTLGQITNVQFSHAQFGMALAETLFQLEIDEDVELVDSRNYIPATDG